MVPLVRSRLTPLAVVLSLSAAAVAHGEPKAPDASTVTCPPNMAFIPGGTFKLGERDGTATVKPFCLDKTEVTVQAYATCVQSHACSPAFFSDHFNQAPPGKAPGTAECNADKPGRQDHPLNCVDWNQAAAFCKARGQRLPTEEEWEWAARGAELRAFPWGNSPPSDQLCWKRRNADHALGTCAVGSFPAGASPLGVLDLAGNVWEWTASSEKCDAKTECRVRRGGGWSSRDASRVSPTIRFADPPTQRQSDLGFRCAR